mmetsp:Transcript_78330/g.148881  ORF Transcript_78330/g.148881 Transcript_78330/m.148881 type:complete len:635 (-) Transcript_78330:113-2017(-)
MVDYSSKLRSAEEEVATYIEGILTEGGHLLWQKYLQRKAFPFAAETGIDALTSQLRMCFVAHDPGESESQKDWELEEEPVPGDIDNWARMHLAVRRPQRREPGDETALLGRPRTGDGTRRNNIRTRVSDARGRARGQGRSDKSEARSWGVQDEVFTVDEDEEKLREAKAQEEQRKRDKENKLKLAEKQKEDEQRKVQALHEEMARKQHTFDSEGNIIWVEEIKMDRLPKVQEFFPYDIKKDPRSRDRLDETLKAKAAASPTAKKKADKTNARRKARFDRSSKKKEDEDDFPDGFSKLKHGQPPILETMVVKPGVVLDSGGKQKAGPAVKHSGGGMSRKEYVAWTEQEGAKEAAFNQIADAKEENTEDKGDASPQAPGERPGSSGRPDTASKSAGPGANAAGGASGPANPAAAAAGAQATLGPSEVLPPIGGRTSKVGGLSGSRPGTSGSRPGSGGGGQVQVQKAPSAPPMHVRQKKMEAVGHLGRHPRLHIAPLGGPYGFAAAPPPLGATMGHGLLRSGSAKEAYFFPSGNPEMPDLSNMLRSSQSEAHLPKERSYLSATGSREEKSAASRDAMASRESMQRQSSVQSKEDEPLDQKNGVIRPDRKSPAYKGMRHALFPHAGDTGLSQYGAQYT